MKLDGSEFKGRQLKVTHKRVNQPGFVASGTLGRGGGRGFRGRVPFRGGRGRARVGPYRGGRGGYHPYY